ncbi:ABC transporter ATP-binding protein [Curtobacterium flaccumfaciens]|uniref:ABC transporter ATP-binding protein n=1 Tax=Curtobacterium flaccumfaciens TaxID=2035 RepID=UPI0020331878|nr:ABC transporter ATP-binding protein [Curtobacterium flaccumfaciens]MCS0472189.1 ABC transporter ATP-binding protein [Curtobacterium flaccumfaciens pv. betae]MCS0474015.1 ABC transporter ATP-binding protein [Curtobacterium flaccumfaciens pv. betae]MCS0478929.1 ABC transporter ATP-binding protein [Curtobacterium flaccumfaciens pv. betae]MCS0480980.1 ABC transporter ATP-binding protein [Curtobacterium flaccumfaciens pv. betae]MCS0485611.1 ABC transporter ATP-binding protein [Curtobacterium fla
MNSLISAVGLSRSFRGPGEREAIVLDDITVSVPRGEFVTIVGPSGSGKSTLLQCLSGLDSPSSGSVRIDGTDLATLRGDALARFRRDHLGFVFQSYNLIPALTAFDNVALPLRLASGSLDRSAVHDALAAVGLSDVARQRPGQLSGGQQQRVAIARTIVTAPDVVFADEPTGALDSESGARVLALLQGAATGSRSVVMVTHDLEAAARGDRVLVLRDGRLHRELVAPTAADVLQAVSR